MQCDRICRNLNHLIRADLSMHGIFGVHTYIPIYTQALP